ncbi:hypothetical protein GCM10008904_07570 [Paraclostridium ghonii]|uniref:Uncharacterized protein n=1 Tax=Paraclostridium ghonii TaxID=29358 RepID=A0ABU0N2V5_9FIRM|nr:hypothetical protein [Paeniclostridium ghonii]MDQ0557492.1 hypothetical protein [Paeniclostridium ghonii]
MKFIFAKVTNSRLMGSMGLIIGWEDKNDIFYQYFLIDAEGLGIADYVSLRNASYEELNREQERLMGGLGADRIQLTEEEALSLVNYYGKKTYYWEKELPGNVEEYIEFIENYEVKFDIFDLYPKICKKIDNDIEFINYMTMRFIAWDKDSLKYFSNNEQIADMHITNINGALLKNKVNKKDDNIYVCDVLYEDSDGYYTCKLAFNISYKNDEYKIDSLMFTDKEGIYDFEVFDEISKSEYIAIYDLKDKEKFLDKFYKLNPFVLKSELDLGVLFTRFNFDNNHVKEETYVINNDLSAIYYQMNDKFFVATYNPKDRLYINKLIQCNFKDYLYLEDEMFFEQNVLYDFVESESEDFFDFID